MATTFMQGVFGFLTITYFNLNLPHLKKCLLQLVINVNVAILTACHACTVSRAIRQKTHRKLSVVCQTLGSIFRFAIKEPSHRSGSSTQKQTWWGQPGQPPGATRATGAHGGPWGLKGPQGGWPKGPQVGPRGLGGGGGGAGGSL